MIWRGKQFGMPHNIWSLFVVFYAIIWIFSCCSLLFLFTCAVALHFFNVNLLLDASTKIRVVIIFFVSMLRLYCLSLLKGNVHTRRHYHVSQILWFFVAFAEVSSVFMNYLYPYNSSSSFRSRSLPTILPLYVWHNVHSTVLVWSILLLGTTFFRRVGETSTGEISKCYPEGEHITTHQDR